MAWIDYSNNMNTPRQLVHEVCDLQVINKNKSYTTHFTFEYETDGSGNFLPNARVTLEVKNGAVLIDTQQGFVTISDLGLVTEPLVQSMMVKLVKDYMKI